MIFASMKDPLSELFGGAQAQEKCQWVSANVPQSFRGSHTMVEKIIENMCRGGLSPPP